MRKASERIAVTLIFTTREAGGRAAHGIGRRNYRRRETKQNDSSLLFRLTRRDNSEKTTKSCFSSGGGKEEGTEGEEEGRA